MKFYFKKILLLLLILFLSSFLYKFLSKEIKKFILLKKTEKLEIKINPKTTVFAFDLHEVVLDVDEINLIKIISKNLSLNLAYFLLRKDTYYYIYNLLKKRILLDQAFDELTKKYPNFIELKNLLIDLINAQKLDFKMIEIIKYLKRCGYKCYILSNIWQPAYQKLQKKFPVLNEIFDGFYIPYKLNGKYLHKPEKDFYENFKKVILKKEFNQVIFIDNSLKNVEYANDSGLIGIIFHSSYVLLKQLKKWEFSC